MAETNHDGCEQECGCWEEGFADALAEGRSLGEGPDALARRIRGLIPKGPWTDIETRARVIARTETKFAQNVSSVEAYRHSGVVEGVLVYDAQAGRSDGPCAEADGQVWTFEQAAGNPLQHPNCTRSFGPHVPPFVREPTLDA